MSDFAPVIAAFIIGSVTLLTVFINVLSAQAVRKQERSEKQQEWIRDKQVQDLEEIVPTLSKFLNDLSSCLESVEANLSSAYQGLDTLAKAKKYDVEAVNVKFLQRFMDHYEKDSNVLWQLDTERRAWFGFEAKRRSIWFDEADNIELRIDDIAKLLRDFHLDVHKKTSALRWVISDVVNDQGGITGAKAAEAEGLKISLSYTLSNWSEISSIVIDFQKTLADKYKATRPNGTHGSLVQAAIRLERWLKRFRQ